jgi:hypothetical protein
MKNVFASLVFLLASQQVLAQQPFQTFDMIVTDPAGVVAAMNKLQASPTGQQSTARVILNQYLANGESLATHQILVVYPSTEEMDANIARNALSPDWAEFLTEMQEVATVEAEGVGQILAVGGDINNSVATAIGRTNMYYQMSVTDPAAYASAWSDFTSANADTGVISYLSGVVAFGSNPSTHVVTNVYSSPGEAVANMPQNYAGWDAFSQRVSNIRTIEGRGLSTVIAEWLPE